MGKSFNLRVKPTRKSRCNVLRDLIDMKSKQLEEVVQWCQVNSKCGWAAINSGKFPLIKDLRTINKRRRNIVQSSQKRKKVISLLNIKN